MTGVPGPDAAAVDFDVVVVGAGPVGCALALLLGRHGRSVLLVERHQGPYPRPRAVHFDDETARILQACGIGGELPTITEPAARYEWRNADGVPLLRFDLPLRGRQGWPSANMFNQPDLEALLLDEIADCPAVTLRWGQAAVGVGSDDATAWVELEAADSGAESHRVYAKYVAGCDGANSTIGSNLGVEFEDRGFFFDWLVVDVRLREERSFDPPNLQVCDPARPTTVVSGGPGRRRWEFMCLPGEALDALDAEACAWAFLEPWDVRPDNAELVRHAGYRFGARWATRWHVGRVFLAGDAAHQTPPFAGQGMCTGLRDAANLAWKLDHVLSRPQDSALLDTYDLERIPHAGAVIELATELGKVICIPDPEVAAERDAAMAPLVPPGGSTPAPPMPGLSAGVLGPGPHAGELFVQGRVRADSKEGWFDDVVGVGWHLVVAGPGLPVAENEATWIRSIGGRVVTIGVDVEDLDGSYSRWFAQHGAAAALERPDFYLYGTAVDAAGTTDLVRSLRETFQRFTRSGGADRPVPTARPAASPTG